jgi:hypothetical protein
MKRTLPIVVTVVVVIGLLMFAAHSFDLLGFAQTIHGG